MMKLIPSYYDERNKIWSGGKEEPYYHEQCSIGKFIFTTMRKYPNEIIQISDIDGVTMTNSEAITAAIRIAQHFKTMGLHQDDIVGIAARNSTYVMPLAVACFLNCTPFHAVNPIVDEKSLMHIFGITKPKVIFCDGQDYEKIQLATKMFTPQLYTMIDHISDVPKIQDLMSPTKTEHFYKPEALLQGGDQTIAILCSSSTTGLTKGVCISNRKMMSVLNTYNFNNGDVSYCASGLDWLSGFLVTTFCCTTSYTRIISTHPFIAAEFVDMVQKYRITYGVVPSGHITSLIKCPTATPQRLASLHMVTIGGSMVTLATLQALQRIAKNAIINHVYGTTEVGIITSNFSLDKGISSGKLLSEMSVRIVDNDGKNLGPNEVGEIFVHQKKVWNGYYENPLETQRSYDSQGWYHTGDVGYFDDEHFLYVVDRKKEILKYKTMHYWPTEIENCIAQLPDVIDVCVIGVFDENYGDLAGALVVKTEGSSLSAKEIKDYVKKELIMPHKQLNAGVLFVENLPQNNNGKILKKEAKGLFIAAMATIE